MVLAASFVVTVRKVKFTTVYEIRHIRCQVYISGDQGLYSQRFVEFFLELLLSLTKVLS